MSESAIAPSPALRSRYRTWLGAGALILLGLGFYWQLGPGGSLPSEPRSSRAPVQATKVETELTLEQLQAVKIAPAGTATFRIERRAVGNIDFNQTMLVQVFTPYQGRIIQTFANVGDRVKKGEILFTVDSPDLLGAESNLIQNAGLLILQNANLRRLTETLKGGGGAQKDVDQARSDQQTAEGNLRATRDTLRLFGKTDEEIDQIIKDRRADSALIVRSPIAGLVTQRTAAPGLLVQPGNAPAPFTVADTSTMWMLANVVEAEVPQFKVGQPIAVRVDAYPDRVFDGTIAVVGAQVDPATRRLLVRSAIKDPDGLLRAGMFATFTIEVAPPVRSTAVASSGVVRVGDGSMTVWTTTDRRHFERRFIKTGLQQNDMTQILDGLAPGELVVTDGAVFVSNKALGGSSVPD